MNWGLCECVCVCGAMLNQLPDLFCAFNWTWKAYVLLSYSIRLFLCSCCSSETSSYSSESRDDEEIALAIQAAEAAARQEARSRFKSAADLIHRLFVCISGKLLLL
jgi:hypothetical protein